MSSANTLARPYARAAFELARDAAALPLWAANLAFSAAVAADSQAAALIGNPRLTTAQLTALFLPADAAVDSPFGKFIAALAANRRLAQLPEIAVQFGALQREHEQVLKVVVRTAVAMDAAQSDAIKASLKRRFQRDIVIETAIDPALIGGAVIDAGDVVIDGSVRGRLARLQQALAH